VGGDDYAILMEHQGANITVGIARKVNLRVNDL